MMKNRNRPEVGIILSIFIRRWAIQVWLQWRPPTWPFRPGTP